MPLPSLSFTFWLCVSLPPSLLLTLWEVSKRDGYHSVVESTTTTLKDRFEYLTSTLHWRMPTSFSDLTHVESLLFAVYAGYLIILAMCYLVITNIRHVNREMEKTIHDANEEMAATGLLQLEDKSLPEVQQVIQKQRDVAELLEQEVRRVRTEMFSSECKVGDMEKVIHQMLLQWEMTHGKSLLEQEAEHYSVLKENFEGSSN